jgi:tetratricopeptide (TPR) repeat protein
MREVLPKPLPKGWAAYGKILGEKGYEQEARLVWTEAVTQAPRDVSIREGFARFLNQRGDHRKAREQLLRVLDSEGKASKSFYRLLVETDLSLGDREQGLRRIEEAIALWPRDPAWRSLQAHVLRKGGQLEQALVVYQSLSKEFPTSAAGPFGEGTVLEKLGRQARDRRRLRKALRAYREALARSPDQSEVRGRLAELYCFVGDSARAQGLLEQLVEERRATAFQKGLLAERLVVLLRIGAALRLAREARREQPDVLIGGMPAGRWMVGILSKQAIRSAGSVASG